MGNKIRCRLSLHRLRVTLSPSLCLSVRVCLLKLVHFCLLISNSESHTCRSLSLSHPLPVSFSDYADHLLFINFKAECVYVCVCVFAYILLICTYVYLLFVYLYCNIVYTQRMPETGVPLMQTKPTACQSVPCVCVCV